jgi:hypothetical protein
LASQNKRYHFCSSGCSALHELYRILAVTKLGKVYDSRERYLLLLAMKKNIIVIMSWSVGDAIMQSGVWSHPLRLNHITTLNFDFHTISGIVCGFMVMLKLCRVPNFGSELDKEKIS